MSYKSRGRSAKSTALFSHLAGKQTRRLGGEMRKYSSAYREKGVVQKKWDSERTEEI